MAGRPGILKENSDFTPPRPFERLATPGRQYGPPKKIQWDEGVSPGKASAATPLKPGLSQHQIDSIKAKNDRQGPTRRWADFPVDEVGPETARREKAELEAARERWRRQNAGAVPHVPGNHDPRQQ